MERWYDPENECKSVITNIQKICDEKKISHYVLASRAGISTSTLYELMRGRTKPYLYTVFKLCNALDVGIERILGQNCLWDVQNQEQLSVKEKMIIDSYRNFTDEEKKFFEVLLDMMVQYTDFKFEKQNY